MTAGLLRHYRRAVRALFAGTAIVLCATVQVFAADPIKIGQVAALSGASAQSGEAITRGLTLAIEEINARGGLLGVEARSRERHGRQESRRGQEGAQPTDVQAIGLMHQEPPRD